MRDIMEWNRLYLKNWIKSRNLIPRARQDGLLTDELICEAIDAAIEEVADFCHLLPVLYKFPLRANQWKYPMPEDVLSIRNVWYKDSSGNRQPLDYRSTDNFLNWRDPEDDTSTEPSYFAYPTYQSRVLEFYAIAPELDDYVSSSYITTESIRTVIDSGINFGLTLDGTRVEPGCIVHNITDDSYGYVEVLDIKTNKTTGWAGAATNTNTLSDTSKDFTALGVAVGDIICTPSGGVVTSYAFVTAVGTTALTYAAMQGVAKYFKNGDSYKVGKAQEIRLSMATPHPGLRDGATNDFTVSSVKATITGTAFTATTCTGNSTSGAEVGDIAIASGGSHGKITSLTSTVLTTDKWIGGQPGNGETVTVKECDEYQVETKHRIERVMWIGPTPSASDTVGSESMEILYAARPTLPEEDDDPIEIPEKYKPALLKCLVWKAAELRGTASQQELEALEAFYTQTVMKYRGDVWQTPLNKPLTVWGNRNPARYGESRYMTPSGLKWNI